MNDITKLRDIPGYEGLYAVSADGRVWAHDRRWVAGRHINRHHPAHWMRIFKSERGYLRVNLKRDGKSKSMNVHRLVALAWIPNPNDLPQVNHLNGVKGDNRVSNLEWCTAAENSQHAHRNGLVNLNTETFRASVRRNVLAAHAATRGKPRARRAA